MVRPALFAPCRSFFWASFACCSAISSGVFSFFSFLVFLFLRGFFGFLPLFFFPSSESDSSASSWLLSELAFRFFVSFLVFLSFLSCSVLSSPEITMAIPGNPRPYKTKQSHNNIAAKFGFLGISIILDQGTVNSL